MNREGEIGVYNPKEKRTKRRYLFLFNDVLLITKKEGKTSYWLKVFVSLRTSLRVEDVPDSQTPNRGMQFAKAAPYIQIILITLGFISLLYYSGVQNLRSQEDFYSVRSQ
jgi:hypothetical protein